MSYLRTVIKCDWCETEESYDEEGQEFTDGWFVVQMPPNGEERSYCSSTCMEQGVDLLGTL